MAPLPTPVRAALGLAAVTVEQAHTLPDRVLELPVLFVSTALQCSVRVQQRYAELALRGDELLGRLHEPPEEPPSWATFDDEVPEPEASADSAEAAPGDSAQVAPGDSAQVTPGDFPEAAPGDSAQVAPGDSAEVTPGDAKPARRRAEPTRPPARPPAHAEPPPFDTAGAPSHTTETKPPRRRAAPPPPPAPAEPPPFDNAPD
jgi:hypothetical protein